MRSLVVCSLLALLFCSGCAESGPEVVPISGTVMRHGKPVPGLDITFQPVEGRTSFARSDENGKFKLRYSRSIDGARVGKHTVFVSWRNKTPQDEYAGVRPSQEIQDILKVYGSADTTPLTDVEITEETEDYVLNLDS